MTEQRDTFDQVADLYDDVRPAWPPAAVEALWTRAGLAAGDAVVEVGCGTGQLTGALLARGAHVVAVEPGEALAARCAAKHPGAPLRIVSQRFEAWTPEARVFRAVVAAQAAHWIAPPRFLDRSAQAMAPGGWIGLLWHLDRSEGTDFWRETQPLYDRYLPDAAERPPRTLPDHVERYAAALAAEARWAGPQRASWTWAREFDAEGYLRLLRTHSPVRMLGSADRDAFLEGHARILRARGGRVTRQYETVLVTARLDR